MAAVPSNDGEFGHTLQEQWLYNQSAAKCAIDCQQVARGKSSCNSHGDDMKKPRLSRPHSLAGPAGILMGDSIGAGSPATIDWRSVPPAEAGLADNLEALLDKAIAEKRIWNLHSIIVVRNGRLALERYFDGEDDARGKPLGVVSFKPDTLHDLRSVSKSIVGLLYGIALAAGKVPRPERLLAQSFPEYADLFADPGRKRWTVHHVLSMTMGTDWDELSVPYTNPANSEIAMDKAPDRNRYVLERPIVTKPGKRWTYCGGATALLGRIIAKGTGKSLHDYAREALFDPLGMGPTDWFIGRDGEPVAASGIRMLPRDLARIGQLLLRGGALDDRVVVPPEWIARCTSSVVPIDEVREYGYHWYLGRVAFEAPTAPRWNRSQLERYWSAAGNGGQRLLIFPGLDLLVVTMFGNYDTPDQSVPPGRVVREVVLPAIL
jgi:CubicO group peptidase (beta-lactamase class C family)